MPIHDWSRVDAGIYHDFHQTWTIELRNALNHGVLPPGFFALAEQVVSGPIPDVVTLQQEVTSPQPAEITGGIAVADAPPCAQFIAHTDVDRYTRRANRLTIKHELGRVVAVIEIVSPGNKTSRHALRSFIDKAYELLQQGINMLIVDLFPPSPRDPQGIHTVIWDEFCEHDFQLPAEKQRTAVAYAAGAATTAYVEPLAVGDPLPALPIFLATDLYVPAPLEATYQAAWTSCPAAVKQLVLRVD